MARQMTLEQLVQSDGFAVAREAAEACGHDVRTVADLVSRDAVARGISIDEAAAEWAQSLGVQPRRSPQADLVAEVADADYFAPLRKRGLGEDAAELLVGEAKARGVSLEETAKRWADQLAGSDEPKVEEEAPAAPLDVTREQLYADRVQLDRVAQIVAEKLELDYLGALDEIERAFDLAPPSDRPVTLADALPAPMTAAEMEGAIVGREARHERKLQEINDALPPEPEGEVTDGGRVLLPAGTDRAKLLTESYEFEKAYLEAHELGFTHLDRDAFGAIWRPEVEAGYDLLGTWRHQKRVAADVALRTEQYWRRRGRGPGGEAK